jgi:GT2 family glycosyltransferase
MAVFEYIDFCRGDSTFYVEFRTHGSGRVSLRAVSGPEIVPTCLVETGREGDAATWAAVLPYVYAPFSLEVLVDDAVAYTFAYPTRQTRAEIKRRDKNGGDPNDRVRGVEARVPGLPEIKVDGVYPSGDDRIFWISVSGSEKPRDIRLYDGWMRRVFGTVVELEKTVTEDALGIERIVTRYSVRTPKSVDDLLVWAAGDNSAFLFLKRDRIAWLEGEWWKLTRNPMDGGAFHDWALKHSLSEKQLSALSARYEQTTADKDLPSCNVVVDGCADADAVRATLASLDRQIFKGFVVSLVGAKESFDALGVEAYDTFGQAVSRAADRVATMHAGDLLEPYALLLLLRDLDRKEEALFSYCDEDAFHGPWHAAGRLKNRFCHENLLCGNDIGRIAVFDTTACDFSGCVSPYEMLLRAYEQSPAAAHVETILLHQGVCATPARYDDAAALEGHLERIGVAGTVSTDAHGDFKIAYDVASSNPKVSIVIPNRKHLDYLKPCLESIFSITTYENYEVIVVENGSGDDPVRAYYDEVQAAHPDACRVVEFDGPFNYSKVLGFGASHATGDFILFLNNDTKVLTPDWLQLLAGPHLREEVGVTGAKLLFPDGLVQHAGMMALPDGGFGHMNQFMSADDYGYLGTLSKNVSYSMVTGACQMVKRSVWDKLGGYDERLAIGFNDGDFCMRAREHGYDVVLVNDCVLEHREFGTRSRESVDVREQERWFSERCLCSSEHVSFFAAGDPYINSNLDKWSRYYHLQW